MKTIIWIKQRIQVEHKTEEELKQALSYIDDGTIIPHLKHKSAKGFEMKTYGKSKIISSKPLVINSKSKHKIKNQDKESFFSRWDKVIKNMKL